MRQGFTLVELSIVLVIIGLITGGILGGQHLIRSAGIRATTSQTVQFQTAVNSFYDKYRELPGDMPNATKFWGAADNNDGLGSDCYTVNSFTLADPEKTCNGNGDGIIYVAEGASTSAVWRWAERFRFWQHLANAGLVEGGYMGRTDSTTSNWAPNIGRNVPAAKIGENTYFDAYGVPNTGGGVNLFPSLKYNFLVMTGNLGATSFSSPLTPKEMWSIDDKIDDGYPGSGDLRSAPRSSTHGPNCTTTDDERTAEYDVSNTSATCLYTMRIDH